MIVLIHASQERVVARRFFFFEFICMWDNGWSLPIFLFFIFFSLLSCQEELFYLIIFLCYFYYLAYLLIIIEHLDFKHEAAMYIFLMCNFFPPFSRFKLITSPSLCLSFIGWISKHKHKQSNLNCWKVISGLSFFVHRKNTTSCQALKALHNLAQVCLTLFPFQWLCFYSSLYVYWLSHNKLFSVHHVPGPVLIVAKMHLLWADSSK